MSGKVILGTGRRAAHPYYMERFYVNLYSVEELCFVLVDKAELLDHEIMQRDMVRWLDEECGLSDLAHALYALLNQKGSTVAFVGTILEYVCLYSPEVIARTEEIVRNNEGLSPYERHKAKADYLLKERRYFAALEQYQSLLSALSDSDSLLQAKIYHNMGAACAGMFMYERAADWFMKSHEIDGRQESLLLYLAAHRMSCSDKEYIDYIAKHPEYHDASLKVERMMERAAGVFEGSDENRMLVTLQVFKEEGNGVFGNTAPYYNEIGRLTSELKEKYRSYTA